MKWGTGLALQRLGNWLTSLHFRLIVGFTLVLAVSLIGVSLYVRHSTAREIHQFQEEFERVRAQRIERVVAQYYDNNKDLAGIEPMLDQAKWLYNWTIDVTDPKGKEMSLVNAKTAAAKASDKRVGWEAYKNLNERPELHQREKLSRYTYKIKDDDKEVASIEMGPAALPGSIQEPATSQLLARMDASLLWTGMAAGILGIALVSLLSRRALLSVGVLRAAARTFGGGQYSHRVPRLRPHEIGELGEAFNSMAGDIQRAERQRLNLMADVAHELQTPLSNIQGYVEAMKDGVMKPNDETLDSVHRQVLHLNHLVDDVKLLSLMDAGALRLNYEMASIGDVIRRSVSGFRAKAQSQRITLCADTEPDTPPVRMDTARVLQVVDNLIENAIRHTPPGGKVTARSESLSAGETTVAVVDNGEGIPEEMIETVFDRFRRADPSRARATGGAGLGLSIAKNLVEAHGGTISAESRPGIETTFTFTIPRQRRPEDMTVEVP